MSARRCHASEQPGEARLLASRSVRTARNDPNFVGCLWADEEIPFLNGMCATER